MTENNPAIKPVISEPTKTTVTPPVQHPAEPAKMPAEQPVAQPKDSVKTP
ncbi:MAG: hypothetical protein ACRD9W_16915 [Terriglobia bacterium]